MLKHYLRQVVRLWSLTKEAFGNYTGKIIGLTLLTFGSSVLEGLGITTIIPLFSYISGGAEARSDTISRGIDGFFRLLHLTPTVKYLLLFIALLFLVKAALLYLSQVLSLKVMINYEKKTMAKLFSLMLSSNWSQLSKQKVGYLDQVILTDVDRSSGILFHIVSLGLMITSFVIYTILIVNISVPIALLAVLFGAGVFLFFKPLFYKNRVASGRIADLYKEVAHFVNEHIIGLKTVKALGVEPQVAERGQASFDQLKNLRWRVEMLRNLTTVIVQPVALLFLLGIFAFFYKTAAFNFAAFAVVVYAINRVFINVQSIQSEIHDINSRIPHLLSVLRYRDESREHQEARGEGKEFLFSKSLEFRSVSYAYAGSPAAIRELSFRIRPGELVGLIGPSGAGKTTVVDLLLRLLKPESGVIALDDIPSEEIFLAQWRTNIGYVSQDVFLLNDTVANNIRFYNDDLTVEQVAEAAKQAQCYDFIQRLPRQFETMVGERGLRLSGGERQRVALARVLARRPAILILDEATSALDNESELLVQRAIEGLRGHLTVMAIAHRLSSVVNFDRVLVLDHGKIVEDGPPQTLLHNPDSYFSKLYHLKDNI